MQKQKQLRYACLYKNKAFVWILGFYINIYACKSFKVSKWMRYTCISKSRYLEIALKFLNELEISLNHLEISPTHLATSDKNCHMISLNRNAHYNICALYINWISIVINYYYSTGFRIYILPLSSNYLEIAISLNRYLIPIMHSI